MFNYRRVISSKCSDKYENGRQARFLSLGLLSADVVEACSSFLRLNRGCDKDR